MTADDPYSVEAAKRAADDGRLAEWVTTFLASPGSNNEALAAELAFSGASFLGPVRFALDDLHPLAGPDDHDVSIPVPRQEWADKVDAMDESLARGWEPPPLLVSYRDGTAVVEDGNHRHEALRRAGATHTWAVLVFWDESERSAFSKSICKRHP
ncbi:MAG: ParB/RepB/Spo0J family partition protein [Acidimicrobiia bacterium]|nr:ParB/RepB/Spo0J family partition protein [Acidimicrobiia bacterium]